MISIIIPIYNAEKDLDKCLSSLTRQTYLDYELLLVNDGSTDNSECVCRRYAKNDTRIKLINKENGGVSSARNLGLDQASGEFIVFVDADDWVAEDYLESLLSVQKSLRSDLVVSNLIGVLNTGDVKYPRFEKEELISNTNFTPSDLVDDGRLKMYNAPYCKLFKADIIRERKLKFRNELRNGEDFIFVLEYALCCGRISFLNQYSYYYNRLSESSVTNRYYKNYYENLIATKNAYLEILSKYRVVSPEEKLYQYFRVALKALLEEGKKTNHKSFIGKTKTIRRLLNTAEMVYYRSRYSHLVTWRACVSNKVTHLLILVNSPLLFLLYSTLYSKIR